MSTLLTKKQLRKIYREWDKQRENATGPSDRNEIDAIFSREIDRLERSEHDRV
jgi:hypothetical protein